MIGFFSLSLKETIKEFKIMNFFSFSEEKHKGNSESLFFFSDKKKNKQKIQFACTLQVPSYPGSPCMQMGLPSVHVM